MLLVGKIPLELLTKYMLNRDDVRNPSVVVDPAVGEDFAIIDFG